MASVAVREAILYEKKPENRVQCHVCQWRCSINPGKLGVCHMRRNNDGILDIINYAQVSSVAIDPIEKKPLFHFHPGTRCFSLGGWGCNFHCQHCQNWQISCAEIPDGYTNQTIMPQEAIVMAQQEDCQGIAWTYNEPIIWLEYTIDSAKLAKANNLYTVYVTNGYATPEALDAIGPYLDAWRVDVKGFSDAAYKQIARVPHWRGILEVAQRAQEKWHMHLEVVTNIIPGINDDDAQLEGIARWINDMLGPLTPWHVTRFYPQYQMLDKAATPVETLEKACRIGHKAGLKFIYAGNVPGHSSESTVCYNCGRTAVERSGYRTRIVGLLDGKCKYCGADLNFRMSGKRRE